MAEAKTAGVGQKMDLAFSLLRLDIAAGDWQVQITSCSTSDLGHYQVLQDGASEYYQDCWKHTIQHVNYV